MERAAALDQSRRARNEFVAARMATRHAVRVWKTDTGVARVAREDVVTVAELRRAADHLEVTFTLGLFSEFEAVLRNLYRAGMGRVTRPDMEPLMNAIASRCKMNPDHAAAAHDVRTFRNDIIHTGLLSPRFDLPASLSRLARFLSWLPPRW